MGFFQLDEVFEAFRTGTLAAYCAKLNPNDLAILKHEISGYAAKDNPAMDVEALLSAVEKLSDR